MRFDTPRRRHPASEAPSCLRDNSTFGLRPRGHYGRLFSPSRPASKFYMGDHLTMNLDLTLLAGGGYSLNYSRCEGLYGAAVGTWRLAEDRLLLEPVDQHGPLAKHPIRVLLVWVWDDSQFSYPPKIALVPEDVMPTFLADGVQDHSCFRPSQTVWKEWLRE
jgi:hypothetical protein